MASHGGGRDVGDPEHRMHLFARAPGRVNLVGEHTDYNGGLALPAAIDLETHVRFVPDDSGRLRIASSRYPGSADIAVHPPPDAGEVAGADPVWARLPAALVREGRPARGGSVSVTSTVPAGSGLSSSAALCVGLSLALGVATDEVGTAELCRRAEAAAGSEVGLMDPLVSMAGQAGHALLVDFSDLRWRPVRIPAEAELVVVSSDEPRDLARTGYPARRAECAAASRAVGIPLGRAGTDDLRAIADPMLRRRARHVVTECARVRAVARSLSDGDLAGAGDAMIESHRSQAEDFAVSTPAVDELVRALACLGGVHGARLCGGGFGGWVVVLAERGAYDPQRWPGHSIRVRPAPGASVRVIPGRTPAQG